MADAREYFVATTQLGGKQVSLEQKSTDLDARREALVAAGHSSHEAYKVMLQEHLERSELPELFGVPRRVIEALNQRVGHSSIDIQHIADDLHFSKRTLQRRLREQGYCFSDLRDLVRRHHGIRAVLDGHQRVDDICIALDFADRSSLTLAFKRWTGFSPRAFGRVFRDYLDVRR